MKKVLSEKFSQFKLSRQLSSLIKGGQEDTLPGDDGVPCGCLMGDTLVSCSSGRWICTDHHLGTNYTIACSSC